MVADVFGSMLTSADTSEFRLFSSFGIEWTVTIEAYIGGTMTWGRPGDRQGGGGVVGTESAGEVMLEGGVEPSGNDIGVDP